MINRKLTGSSIHIYINPKKPVGDSDSSPRYYSMSFRIDKT